MAGTAPRAPRVALLALAAANLALACGPWLVRLAESEARVGPIASAFWRLALSLPVLAAATRVTGESLPPRPGRLVLLAMLSGVLFAADLAAWHVGILHTRMANATLLGNVTAVLFPAYGFIVARRWPSRRQAVALALASAGAALLMGRSYELSGRNMTGDLLCIVAGLCYTGYLVSIDRVRRSAGPLATLTCSVAAGTPVLLIAALALGDPLRPHDWTPLLLLTLGSQIVGQGFILYAVGRLSPLVVGLMLLIQPIVSAAIGWLIYGERLTALDAAGALAIAVAVLLVRDAPPRLRAGENRLSS